MRSGRQGNGNHPIRTAKRKKKSLKNECSLRDLWDNIKHANVFLIEVPEGEEKETQNLFKEIMAENFPHLAKKTDIQVQKAKSVTNKMK